MHVMDIEGMSGTQQLFYSVIIYVYVFQCMLK